MINFSYFNRREYHQIAHLKFEECTDKDENTKISVATKKEKAEGKIEEKKN